MELLLLTAIAWAAAKGVEATIAEVKGRSGPQHTSTASKVAKEAKGGSAVKAGARPAPSGVPATFGRKAAHATARTVAPGASWGRDAVTAYRQSIRDAYRTEADRVRKQRAEAEKAQAGPNTPTPGPPPAPPAPPAPVEKKAPAPVGAAPTSLDKPAPPRLRVLPGGAATPSTPTDPGTALMTILEPGEIGSLSALLRYLRAVASISEINAESATLLADQDAALAARLDAMLVDLAGLGVDDKSLGDLAALQEQVEALAAASRAGADAALAASEAAATAHTGAQARHGGIADAAAETDAPVADAAYYTPEGK